MKSHGITSWRTLDAQTSSVETRDDLQTALYNNVMNVLWTIEKDGDHPLLPFIAHIIGLTPLCVAKRTDDLGKGKTKATIEYLQLFHDNVEQKNLVLLILFLIGCHAGLDQSHHLLPGIVPGVL